MAAKHFTAGKNGFEILPEAANCEAVHKSIEAAGIKIESAEMALPSTVTVPLTEAALIAVDRLINTFDDVKEVFFNADISEAA